MKDLGKDSKGIRWIFVNYDPDFKIKIRKPTIRAGFDPARGTDRSCICVRTEIGFLYFGENYIAASLWTNFYSEFLRRVHTKQLTYRKQ